MAFSVIDASIFELIDTECSGEWVAFTVCLFSVLVAQLCPTLCDSMDCSPPGSSVHGDSPGKNTGVGCHALSRGSSQPRDPPQVSHIADRFFIVWATREGFTVCVYMYTCIYNLFVSLFCFFLRDTNYAFAGSPSWIFSKKFFFFFNLNCILLRFFILTFVSLAQCSARSVFPSCFLQFHLHSC